MASPDASRLYRLTALREACGLTLADMAGMCALNSRRGRESVGRWEQGLSVPHAKRRPKLLEYLAAGLRLSAPEVEEIWEIFVDEWQWDPLRPDELRTVAAVSAAEQDAPSMQQPDDGIASGQPATEPTFLPLETLPSPGPLPRGSRMPLGRNPLFVGRRADLVELASALVANEAAAIGQIETAAATGLGGIGKTQLACEFVHRYGQFFDGGVFWLSFEDERAIPASVAACGDTGALELRSDFALRTLDEQVRLVQAAWQEPVPRLLIFDNCEEPELLDRWRPTSGGCHILVTSRRADWDSVLGLGAVALGVLDRPESIELLCRIFDGADKVTLGFIAEELGDLPLALHLAGSYLHRYRRVVSTADYLEQLRDPGLLDHSSMQSTGLSPTGHVQHVGRTFAISYDKLDPEVEIDAAAHKLLVHAAHFAPGEPIWYDLLVKTLGIGQMDTTGRIRIDEAFTRLVDLGLLETVEEKILRMHRLVAAFVRDVASDDVADTQMAVETVVFDETARINQEGYPLPLLAWQHHLRSVVDVATAREDAEGARLCIELGDHLSQIGDYAGAYAYFEKALDIRRAVFGDEHEETAAAMNALGSALRDAGDLDAARPWFERTLNVREKVLGEKHADTAATLNELGRLLSVARECDDARTYLARALAIAETVHGQQHRLTADYASNLSLCLQDCQHDLEGAYRYLQLALGIRQSILGHDHPLTALSHNNMGYLLVSMERPEQALTHYEEALRIRKSALGDSHPDTAQTLNNMGTLYHGQGDLETAPRYLEEALTVYIRSVGDMHFRTAFCLNNLGLLLQDQGDYKGAADYFQRSISARRSAYGGPHPNTAVSLRNLGQLYHRQGKLETALPNLEEALAICLAYPGTSELLTASCHEALGLALYDMINEKKDTATGACEHLAAAVELYSKNGESIPERLGAIAERLGVS